jgi:hypothetical protein
MDNLHVFPLHAFIFSKFARKNVSSFVNKKTVHRGRVARAAQRKGCPLALNMAVTVSGSSCGASLPITELQVNSTAPSLPLCRAAGE